MQELNRRWRGQDKPTNVLSFPAAEDEGFERLLLGDIAIAYETMAREAEAEGKSLKAHFSHLTVHGLLHLLGYDHETMRKPKKWKISSGRSSRCSGSTIPIARARMWAERSE